MAFRSAEEGLTLIDGRTAARIRYGWTTVFKKKH